VHRSVCDFSEEEGEYHQHEYVDDEPDDELDMRGPLIRCGVFHYYQLPRFLTPLQRACLTARHCVWEMGEMLDVVLSSSSAATHNLFSRSDPLPANPAAGLVVYGRGSNGHSHAHADGSGTFRAAPPAAPPPTARDGGSTGYVFGAVASER
jgi:hypothetical protein